MALEIDRHVDVLMHKLFLVEARTMMGKKYEADEVLQNKILQFYSCVIFKSSSRQKRIL
jgi:hypothetical protein